MKKKIAVFPGSFDPITVGHVDLVNRAVELFDEIIVAIGHNSKKKYLYPLDKRKAFIDKIYKDEDRVSCATYEGLTVNFCKERDAGYILRGIRSSADFEYEKTIAQLNKTLNPEVETIVLISSPQFSHISSTIVREILVNNGNVTPFIPPEIINLL